MTRIVLTFALAAMLVGSASAQLTTLTTTFAGGNGQSGNMFDIVATNSVDICSFDVNLIAGAWDMDVYVVTGGGTYSGNQANAAAWTLIGSAAGVASAGLGPTPLPITLNVNIPAGATQGFYVTVTNGTSISYTNGTTTGAVFASDANISFLEGDGVVYPFAGVFTPRVWNGNINYVLAGGSCGLLPFQTNSAASSLDVDGVTSFGFTGATSEVCIGATSNLNSAAPAGTPSDIAVTFAPHGASLITTPGSQQVNIDIFHPSLFNFNGPPATFAGLLNLQPHPGALTFPIPTGAPFVGSAQQLAVNASAVDGFSLSQAPQLTIVASGSVSPPQSDDGFNQIFINQAPLCGTSVDFYGTTYTDFYQGSNGDCTFTAGSADFTATSAEWQSQMPRIGVAADLEPNNFGTITITNNGSGGAGSWITVAYSNMAEWGTAGLGVTSYDVIFHGPNGHEIANFTTDGTWGTTPVVGGMSLGAGGTNPALVSFDALNGTGLQANVNSTDSVIDENPGGMLVNTTGWSSISFPLFDGSAYLVQ